MKRIIWFIGSIVAICLLVPVPLFAQEALNNEGVVALKQAGLGDTAIIDKIKASKCDFDISADGLKKLKEDGFSDDLINVIIMAYQPPKATEYRMALAPQSNEPLMRGARGSAYLSAALEDGGSKLDGFGVPGSPLGMYDQKIIATVQNRWYALIDQYRLNGSQGVVTVRLQIFNDGHVKIVEVLGGTVERTLSSFCEKAINESGPFDPLPADLRARAGNGPRAVSFTFHY